MGLLGRRKWGPMLLLLALAGFAVYHFKLLSGGEPSYLGANKHQMHGQLARRSDGSPLFRYGAPPAKDAKMKDLLKANGFNAQLSDSISLDRNVTDARDPLCKRMVYNLEALPKTSVIFVFYNEWFSTLLRSVHSVLNRSPPQLLHEIILVDDGSDKEWLMGPLEEYIKHLPKVKLVRQPKRSGLVKARLRGVREATAETFTVLDSHIEVQDGWLEPLMYRLNGEPSRVLMPMVDGIEQETMTVHPGGIGCSLGFLWTLVEHSIPIQKQDQAIRHSDIDPVRSPTMAGGLFTANREFFWHLGGYDEDFGFWGTENLEFSFRIWQCGGSLECMPCSRVYHIFRKGGHPYSLPHNSVGKNKLRTAKLWMGEYGVVVERALGNIGQVDVGPVDKMRTLQKNLKCKSFDWFLKHVYPESVITDLSDIKAMGEVKNPSSNLCLDTLGHGNGGSFGGYGCHGLGGTQGFLYLKSTQELRPLSDLEMCLVSDIRMIPCDWAHGKGKWTFTPSGQLKNHETGSCLAVHNKAVQLSECVDSASPEQVWAMQPFDPASVKADKWWEI